MKIKFFDIVAFIITVIGALNWGTIGFCDIDFVKWVFSDITWISRTVSAIIGLSGLWTLGLLLRCKCFCCGKSCKQKKGDG